MVEHDSTTPTGGPRELISRLAAAVMIADGHVSEAELCAVDHLRELGLGSLSTYVDAEVESATRVPIDVARTASALARLAPGARCGAGSSPGTAHRGALRAAWRGWRAPLGAAHPRARCLRVRTRDGCRLRGPRPSLRSGRRARSGAGVRRSRGTEAQQNHRGLRCRARRARGSGRLSAHSLIRSAVPMGAIGTWLTAEPVCAAAV